MLTKSQIEEIREHLEKAQNPIFYYDNDPDGLCSFVILRRFLGRGKGVAVKSYPDLNAQYAKKAQELKADYVFVLDKPLLTKEFVDEIDKMQLPLVWIDHHEVEGSEKAIENKIEKENSIFLYNPSKNSGKDKSSEPVTYLAYEITKRKEDLWIALMGCIADHYMPSFADEFISEYPEFWSKQKKITKPFDAYYLTEIGRIAQSLSFGLKDSISHVVQFQNFLISCKGPSDIFQEVESNQSFRKKYAEIREKYDALMKRAKKEVNKNLVFFYYTGDLSISAEIANELSFTYPEKYIAAAFIKGGVTNLSLRGKNVKAILEKILKQLENAKGGGHEDASGASIRTLDLEKFKELMNNEVNKN